MIGFTSTLDKPVLDEVDSYKQEEFAHIVEKVPPYTSASDMITNAIIFGFEVEAICKFKFVPSREAEKLSLCPMCKVVMENMS